MHFTLSEQNTRIAKKEIYNNNNIMIIANVIVK